MYVLNCVQFLFDAINNLFSLKITYICFPPLSLPLPSLSLSLSFPHLPPLSIGQLLVLMLRLMMNGVILLIVNKVMSVVTVTLELNNNFILRYKKERKGWEGRRERGGREERERGEKNV